MAKPEIDFYGELGESQGASPPLPNSPFQEQQTLPESQRHAVLRGRPPVRGRSPLLFDNNAQPLAFCDLPVRWPVASVHQHARLIALLAVTCYVLLGWRMCVVLPPLILPQSPKTRKDLRRLWCPRDKTYSFSLPHSTSKLPKQPCTSARSDVSVCGEDKLGSDWHYLSAFPLIFSFFHPFWVPHSETCLSCGSLDDLHCVCLAFGFLFLQSELSPKQSDDMICRTKQQGKLQGRLKLTGPTAQ